jgi:hypothetical protein
MVLEDAISMAVFKLRALADLLGAARLDAMRDDTLSGAASIIDGILEEVDRAASG